MIVLSLLVIFGFGILRSASLSQDFPTCGNCWCIPDNEGLGECPSWKPVTDYNTSVVNIYANMVPDTIYTLECNPYNDTSCQTNPSQTYLDVETAVCAYKFDGPIDDLSCKTYSIITYPSKEDALLNNAIITHNGACGTCSTAKDLSIYLIEDFTTAGKKCASIGLFNEEDGLNCYMDIGLTKECAKIWNYDGIYDGTICGKICTKELKEPNNGPPPSCILNDCLECDEEYAGPIFTAFAGRTRRRSGLLSEIIRPCNSIAQIIHNPCNNSNCGC
jgi:hypothetical protein